MGSFFVSKRKPRAKQAEALSLIEGREAFALLMAMRTGKTKVIIDDWQRSGVPNLLVIAPAGVYKTWEEALLDDVVDMSDVAVFTWESGKKKDTTDFMTHLTRRVLLMNVEALSTVQAARELCIEFLDGGEAMAAVDESVVIKTPGAKRTKWILAEVAPRAKFRRILSGLPSPKSPLDLFCQFWFLDPKILGFAKYKQFCYRYATWKKIRSGGRWIEIVDQYINLEELAAKIEPYSFRVNLEDCYDLPPATYIRREVPLTEEQKRIYAELKTKATAELEGGGHVTADLVVTQLLRLHQVLCGHTRDEQDVLHAIPEHRTRSLLQLLDDHSGHALVWCSYDSDIRKVSEALAKHFKTPVARFWGGNKDTREAEEVMFKTDPACRFMVATAAAGGRGRTWDGADLVVYFSSSPDLDLRLQSEQRAQNVGKNRSVAYVDLVCSGTVEEKIITSLRNKLNMASIITGDNFREWLI